jgi:ubiquinone/menaquinone biosynthesis C-methylase UbiE
MSLSNQQPYGFLPFVTQAGAEVTYLAQFAEKGGSPIRAYKALSFDLLALQPGLTVLDVGCGLGDDLAILAGQVGPRGQVFGLERNPDLAQLARERLAALTNVQVWVGDAEQMPFADAQFDRARADRVLQHTPAPARVLAEMHRVLRPGGILTAIEPDWKTLALYPASPAGADRDEILIQVLEYYQRHLAHALIGRQLQALLAQQGTAAWAAWQVQAIALTLTTWAPVDAVLQLTTAAQALAQERPHLAREIEMWLQAVNAADARGEFLATMPLFFASARKVS